MNDVIRHYDLLIDLARIGLGIAFVPDFCIEDKLDSLFCVSLKNPLPERELAIVYNTHIPVSNATQEFLKYFD